jgi:hypothetical protein
LDDRAETAKIINSIFMGNNRKRKRGDLDDFDDLDEATKKKLRRIEEKLMDG